MAARFSVIAAGLCGCLCAAGQPHTTQATFPSPEELKKYVCEVASQKMIEDEATDKICALIKAEFPGVQFEPDCATVLKEGWDFVTKYCPKGRASLATAKELFPSPDDLKKYVCEVASQKMIQDEATEAICALIKKTFPGIDFDPDCKTVLMEGWDVIKEYCPKGRLSMPSPQEVEKYICEVASQKMIEDVAVDKVCDLIAEKFPSIHFSPDCRTAVKKDWDRAVALCPKGNVALPSPQEVEKYICEVASQKMIEDVATDKVCDLIAEKFPSIHFNPDCRTAVKKDWDKAVALCPKGSLELPSPQEVEKYICDVASQKMIEDVAVDKICDLIAAKFPKIHFSPDCPTAVKKDWDRAVAFCPKGALKSIPSPQDVEKYVCDVATQKLIEEMATDKVCELIKEKFPSVHFNPDCHTAVEHSWDRVARFCSSGGPGRIEKVVCDVLSQKGFEQRATDIACSAAKGLFPNKGPSEAECEKALEGVWDGLVEKCGSNTTVAIGNPVPGIIEKLACKVIKRPLFEHKVLEVMCKELEKEVHIPDGACMGILQRAWNKATSWCPTQATETIVV